MIWIGEFDFSHAGIALGSCDMIISRMFRHTLREAIARDYVCRAIG